MLLIPVLLTATIAGSLLAPFYRLPLIVSCVTLAFCLLGAILLCRRTYPPLLFLFVLFFLLANLRYPLQFPVDQFVEQISSNQKKMIVTAEVLQICQLAEGRSWLNLKILQVEDGDKRLEMADVYRMRLYVAEPETQLLPGDRIRFLTRLRKPRLFGTPGEFHWPRYLASQGVSMTGWVKSAEQISVVAHVEPFLLGSLARWRVKAAAALETAATDEQTPLLRALLLGEGRMLPAVVHKTLAGTGISHLFAISGLHLGLLGAVGYRLLLIVYRRCPRLLNWQPPQRVLPLLILPLLFLYLLLTGDAVSTRRAFCVASFVAAFWLYRYTVNPIRLLASLALLFLLFNPLLLWQPGWQLSFAGAGGILLWRPLWQQKTAHLTPAFRVPLGLLGVTMAATIATTPLVLVNFHLFSPAGILANLFAVPLVAMLALPIGLLGLLLLWFPSAAQLCFSCSGSLLELVLRLSDMLLHFPGFSPSYLFLSRWQYLAIGVFFLPLLFAWQIRNRKMLVRFGLACLLVVAGCGFSRFSDRADLALYMLSVGQGASMLLVNADRQAVLIDGGGLYGDRFDVGERLLAPAIGALGVQRLSAVLLTHDHPDHRKGLLFILEHFPVEQFWTAEHLADLHPDLQRILAHKSIPVKRFDAGWSRADVWRGADLKLFSAPDPQNKNDSSLVLYLRRHDVGILLTGDLEQGGVNRLLAAGIPGPVSVLKLPHHGSRHSNSEHLIGTVHPDTCLVSVGFQNRYRFPAQSLVSFLAKQGISLYRTDTQGTIRLLSSDGTIDVSLWSDGLFR